MDLKRLKSFFFFKKVEPMHSTAMQEIIVFPLPNVVLLPGAVLPLHIFEERYKLMTDDVLASNASLALSFARPNRMGGDALPSSICGAGKVNLLEKYPDGRKDIFVEGRIRLRIIKYIQKIPYIRAIAEQLPDIPFESESEERAYHQELAVLIKRWVFLSMELQDQFINYVDLFTKPHHLADFIGFYFLKTNEEKQKLLETVDRKKRVETILNFIEKKVSFIESHPMEMQDACSLVRTYH